MLVEATSAPGPLVVDRERAPSTSAQGVGESLCHDMCALGDFRCAVLFVGRGHAIGHFGAGASELERRFRCGVGDRPLVIPLVDEGREMGCFAAEPAGPATQLSETVCAFARGAAHSLRAMEQPVTLARRLHDTVAQRLAGLAFLLAADDAFRPCERELCREEIAAALDELRAEMEGAVCGASVPHCAVNDELAALEREHLDVCVQRQAIDAVSSSETRQLIEAFLAEALRNARKHAAPSQVRIDLMPGHETVAITVRNDGAGLRRRAGCGMGLRLLEIEASRVGGVIESYPEDQEGWWRQCLILPAAP